MTYEEKLARDCYQQAKTIHRLLLTLADDLGDLSASRHPSRDAFAEHSDMVSGKLEPAMMAIRNALEVV